MSEQRLKLCIQIVVVRVTQQSHSLRLLSFVLPDPITTERLNGT